MSLSLAYERCVRTRSVAASCRTCVDTCPAGAISLEGAKPAVAVTLDACTDCGLCQAACPTEAFSGAFDVTALPPQVARLACGEAGLPCVGAVSAEDLVALAQRAGRLEVVGRSCPAGAKGHARAASQVAQATSFLAALGLEAQVSWRDETPAPVSTGTGVHDGVATTATRANPAGAARTNAGRATPPEGPRPVPARRQFLGLFVPGALPPTPTTRGRLTFPATLDVKRLREATPTRRRARLLAALPASAAPKVATLPTDAIGFTSSKDVDAATCTGCSACVTACPTGALTSSRLKDQLRFDGSRCVKCGLCHDVCEPKAITLAPALRLVDVLDFAPRALVTLPMTQCGECGASFKDDGRAEVLCNPCREQDAEARELSRSR